MTIVMAYHDIKPNHIEVGRYYVAEVVENNDLKHHKDKTPLGRVRYRIPKLFEGIDDELLPWAMPRFSRFKGGKNNGAFSVPAKNTKIFVVFETPDLFHAYYEPYPYTLKEQLEFLVKDPVDKEEYTKKHVLYCFDNGNLYWLNDDYKDPELKNKKYIKNVGNVQYWYGKHFDWYVKDNFSLEVDSKFTTTANPTDYVHTILVTHTFIAKENSSRTFEKQEVKLVYGRSFQTFADKAERHYARGRMDIVSMGDYLLRLVNGNLEIFTDQAISITSKKSMTVQAGGNLTLGSASELKLVGGTRITKNMELEFEDGETTLDQAEEMMDQKLADYAAQDNNDSGSSYGGF